MEISHLKSLIGGISRFKFVSSKIVLKSELVQRYSQEIEHILKLFKPVVDEIILREIALDEQFIVLLEEVNASIDEASELVESWHQIMSKVYFVLRIESVITKIHGSIPESCILLISLFESLGVNSFLEIVQQCVQKIQQITFIQTSNIIREAMRDQIENKIPRSQHVVEIRDSLSLSMNQELLMEAVALDKLKIRYGRGESHGEVEYVDHMIALISHMHDCHIEKYQVRKINNILIPLDFCCPLSLELISDPVIVASGQTYERAFIKKWLDQGLSICPKTRQTLVHTNLIPNYIVKAWITNWCKANNIELPYLTKPMHSSHTSNLSAHTDRRTGDSFDHPVQASHPRSPESSRFMMHLNSAMSNDSHQDAPMDGNVTSYHSSASVVSHLQVPKEIQADISKLSFDSADSEEQGQTHGQSQDSCHEDNEHFQEHNQGAAATNTVCSIEQGIGDDSMASQVPGDRAYDKSDSVGKVILGAPFPSVLRGPPEFPARVGGSMLRSQHIWQGPSERFSTPTVSSPFLGTRPDLLGVETEVCKLLDDLKDDSIDVQRDATAKLRLLAKHSMENRIVIANCGAVDILVNLLHSSDLETQENAVTALLNLSLNENNKSAIMNANCIDPLIHVLRTGNPEAKENSAATLFSLSSTKDNKNKIGRSGAIGPLVDLLVNGTPQGKKDAATALFSLSIFHENKARILDAGAIRHLVELMDPAAGMVDKAVAVLANLATIADGRSAIGHEGAIPALVTVVEVGTVRGKENAAAALLLLCTNSNKFCSIVLQEGAVPPLAALSKTGTPRGKEKARSLLNYFRNQRHGNGGRA